MLLRKMTLFFIVFVSGAVVLALEIVAGRFLQPKFGSSIHVWGSLISIFLAGLSIGYYVGGHVADRHASFGAFTLLLGLSAVLLLLLPLYAYWVRDYIFMRLNETVDTHGPLLTSLAVFLVPTAVLGAVSPFAVRLLADDLTRLGRQVGALYALSTAGSIFGSLATTFYLIVLLGTRESLYLFGIVQLCLAIVALLYLVLARPGLSSS